MKITALAIGSRGDVKPFVELGKEMVKRGHSFKVAAFPALRNTWRAADWILRP